MRNRHSRNMRQRHIVFLASVCGLASACDDSSVDPITAPREDAGTADAQIMDTVPVVCSEGQTQSCVCTNAGAGTRRCSNGSFGACEACQQTPTSKIKCVAGNYKGVGEGMASSRAGTILGFTIPTESKGNWSFSLASNGSSEFYTVGNGCVHFLDPKTGVDDPKARFFISGTVNCATGLLDGAMKGFYTATPIDDFLAGEKRFFYKGKLIGTFDADSEAFIAGTYSYQEPKIGTGEPPHGEGTWSAKHTMEVLADETEEECLLGRFPEEQFQ